MVADCTFCAVVAGDADAHVVDDGPETTAFLDVNPAAPGHTLVVPDDHAEGLTDLDRATAGRLFERAHRVASALERAYDADGSSLFQSSGAAAGQDVFHVHVHVMPRFEDDDIRFAPARQGLSREEGTAAVERIRAELPE